MSKWILLSGALFALLSVILGAFAAHGLKSKVTPELLHVFQTGVQYQFYHAIALLFLGMFIRQVPSDLLVASAIAMIVGIVFFSGSLYGLALTGQKWLGPVTPLGGLCFIVGWVLMVVAIAKSEL